MATSGTDPMVTAVPIMFLVVMKIADVAREVDLAELHGKDSWRFVSIPYITSQPGKLGRFAYLHTINNMVMFAIFSGLVYSFDGSLITVATKFEGDVTSAVLGFATVLVWTLLPVLEVDEYSQIDGIDDTAIPPSFGIHVGFTILTALLASITGWLLFRVWAAGGTSNLPIYTQAIFGVSTGLTVTLPFIASTKFLTKLNSELAKSL